MSAVLDPVVELSVAYRCDGLPVRVSRASDAHIGQPPDKAAFDAVRDFVQELQAEAPAHMSGKDAWIATLRLPGTDAAGRSRPHKVFFFSQVRRQDDGRPYVKIIHAGGKPPRRAVGH